MTDDQAEEIARRFHYAYEHHAKAEGWETQERSRKEWADVPAENRTTMIETVKTVFDYAGNLWIERGECHHQNVPLYQLRPLAIRDDEVRQFDGSPGVGPEALASSPALPPELLNDGSTEGPER